MSEERHIEWVITGFISKITVSSTETTVYIQRKVNNFLFVFWVVVLLALVAAIVFLILWSFPNGERMLIACSVIFFFQFLVLLGRLFSEQSYQYIFDRKTRELRYEKSGFTARYKKVVVHVLGKKSHVRLEQIPLSRGPANFQIKLVLENWRELTLPCIPTLKDALECAETYRQLLGIEHPLSLES